MKNTILIEMQNSLEETKKTGNVNQTTLNNIESLRNFLKIVKDKWLNVQDSDGFYFYQAIRNVELILGEMERSLENARKTGNGQKIATDSLLLLTGIDRILNATECIKIDMYSIDQVLSMTQALRNMASSVNLIEPLDTSRMALDRGRRMKAQFSALMQELDA